MKIVMFCHSLISDWNHGNAHFLRGIVTELIARGHHVEVFEPATGWSITNLVTEQGPEAVEEFARIFPHLRPRRYDAGDLDVDRVVEDADLVLVHEWSEPELVAAAGRARTSHGGFALLFHDTHHRAVTAPAEMERLDLSAYDGVLAFGGVLRDIYLARGWTDRAWVWHEAADMTVCASVPQRRPRHDLVWIGNWGDDERTEELHHFLLEPARALGLDGTVHGVRYPPDAIRAVEDAGLAFAGWIPNHRVPAAFASHHATVHVPRRAYAQALPGIPTIRVFEALGCGVPLVCAPWEDAEGLFRDGDFLRARTPEDMKEQLRLLTSDQDAAAAVAARGRETVLSRHTCAHRVDDLLEIAREAGAPALASMGDAV